MTSEEQRQQSLSPEARCTPQKPSNTRPAPTTATITTPLSEGTTTPSTVRHIHPCICDLKTHQKERIRDYREYRRNKWRKYEERRKQLDKERKEQEEKEKQEKEEEEDDYFWEFEEEKKKPPEDMGKDKKCRARRVSMISLGIKQVIVWDKPPIIPVKSTKTSVLRKKFTKYCGKYSDKGLCLDIRVIDFYKKPDVPVRKTQAFDLRFKLNMERKELLDKNVDKKPLFCTSAATWSNAEIFMTALKETTPAFLYRRVI